MFQGFWRDLPRPIIGLSPMDGVTDQPFRWIQKKYSNPDVLFTEFTSAEGVSRNALRLFRDFLYDETQRPIVAQIFGSEPKAFYVTAVILGYLGFDGIDINMGCPAKNVSQHGSGAALIRTPKLAQEIVRQTRQGMLDWANGLTLDDLDLKQKTKQLVWQFHRQLPEKYQQRRELPVSVKTRIGYDEPVVKEWISYLLEVEPAVISVHGRTLKQLYSGNAAWEYIAEAVEVAKGSDTLILGNGDLLTPQDVYQRVTESGVDGVLIGRATNGDAWVIGEMKRFRDDFWLQGKADEFVLREPTLEQRIQVASEHAEAFSQAFPEENFLPMRKHMGWYIKGFPFASDYRVRLVLANSSEEVRSIFAEMIQKTGTP